MPPAVLNGTAKHAPKLPTAEPDDEEGSDEADGAVGKFSADGHDGSELIVGRRRTIAKALLGGPKRSSDLCAELKIDTKAFYVAIQCNWFAKHSYGEYRITTAGRTAVTGKQAVP